MAVQHPTWLQHLAVRVTAELPHWPCPLGWRVDGAPGYPAGASPSWGERFTLAQAASRSRIRAVAAYCSDVGLRQAPR